MRIRFGEFLLDEPRYLLERCGERVALRPKVFDLLAQLARHRDRVVRREELVQHLWGTTAVGAGSLSGLVNELRQALGEDGQGPSSIRTVHARGYQFVARVETASDGRPASVSEVQPRMDRSETFSALIGRVAECGAHGIVFEGEGAVRLSDRAERAGFDVRRLFAPEESMASPGRFATQVVESMIESRGWDTVCEALPLPARVGVSETRAAPVAGGQMRPARLPGVGLEAIVSLLSSCARRQPLMIWLDEIERSGAGLAQVLVSLLRRLEDAPVLWLVTISETVSAAPVLRILEGDGGFARWEEPKGQPIGSFASRHAQAALGLDSLPADLAQALISHLGADPAALNEVIERIGRVEPRKDDSEAVNEPDRSPRMLRVEPWRAAGRLRSVDS